jgi:hypothetical protein
LYSRFLRAHETIRMDGVEAIPCHDTTVVRIQGVGVWVR